MVRAYGDSDQAVMRLLNSYHPFSAMIVMRDSQAASAMNVLRSFNLSTPKEVSIISLEDSQLASQLNPPLTCIRYPSERLVDIAMEQLDACLENKPFDDTPLVTGKLISRESVSRRS